MLSPEEIDELKRLAGLLPANPLVVIIGAGVGAASLAILEARPDAVIFSIDNMFPTQQPMYQPGERANLIAAGVWNTGSVIQVWGESQIVGKRWPVPYDMIFVDGDHRYSGVSEDIRQWLRHAKPGAVIAFHDYADKSKKPKAGVKHAVDEMIRGKYRRIGLVRYTISFRGRKK
jgi:predicted O-methyltransferase YrrM